MSQNPGRTDQRARDLTTRRKLILGTAAGGAGALLVGRMWQLQIFQHEDLALEAEANRTRVEEVPPVRGMVFDASGRRLADNVPVFDFWLDSTGVDIETLPDLVESTAATIEADPGELFRTLERAILNGFGEIEIARNLDRNSALAVRENTFRWPGIELRPRYRREYFDGPTMGQLVGFTGPIPAESRDAYLDRGVSLAEDVGLSGIEMRFQDDLRGTSGRRLLEVGALKQDIRELHYTAPVTGANIHLTIDTPFQSGITAILERFLSPEGAGVVIVLDPRNGNVLALVDYPTFDNSSFAAGISDDEFQGLIADPRHPLINHAISGLYPPGSTFKIVAAAAALGEGVVNAETPFQCAGHLILPSGWIFHDWLANGHGTVDLHRAIAESCNVYFYKISGGDPYAGFSGVRDKALARYARDFGFGRATGIDLPHESVGTVPDRTWKQTALGAPWVTGDTYQAAIGQGFVQVNPLQLANMYAAIGNGGTLYRPRLVTHLTNSNGATIRRIESEAIGQLPVTGAHLALIRHALDEAVQGINGTGFRARTGTVRFAAKTGTAEYAGRRDENGNLPSHSWFAGYAPHEDPEIAFAVLIRDGGEGSHTAALVARDVLEFHFGGKVPPLRYPTLAAIRAEVQA